VNWIPQRPTVTFRRDLHDISVAQTNAIAETEAIGPKEVNVHISSAAMCCVLEVMVLDIGEAVTHFRIAAAEALVPEHTSITLDGDVNRHRVEPRINHKFRPKCTRAQL
jgi:hypothetical protein